MLRNRTIRVAKTKGTDQLRSNCEADLRLWFRLCRLLVFPSSGSIMLFLQCYFQGLTELAVRCMCEMLTNHPHFNYRNNIIEVLVWYMNNQRPEVRS